ncbi:hypothetical protein BsWGS_02503 [Bradybaena similaris]
MTSQKRYRQHQESNKNNSRFRDLPPRFKRQKSVPSAAPSPAATPLPAEAHTGKSPVAQVGADTQLDTEINILPAVTKSEPPQQASPPMAPSTTSVFPVEQSHSSKLRPGADVFEPPVSPVTWQWPAKSNPFILSQWDNRQFNRASNTQPLPIPLGTRFGYKLDSPPLSPWPGRNATNFAGQFGMAGCPPWMSPASDICTGQGIHGTPSVYYNNENWAPNQNLMYPHSPGGSWGKPTTPQHLYTTPLQLQQEHATVSSRYADNHSANSRNSARLPVDYTDPDIRTIEMLRELERVADEKDSEDFGVDRKSLVSHHLRMLMCAVDKYTEGIEDGIADISRNDEVSLASGESTPRVSPGPFAMKEKQTKINTKEANPESSCSLWTPAKEHSSWNTPEIEQASSVASQQAQGCKSPVQQAAPMQGCRSPVQQTAPMQGCRSPVQQAVPMQGCRSPLQQASPRTEQPNSVKGQSGSWDLWSSPSFDFSGVLNQNLDELTRNPFSRLKENDEEERKPLYRR